MMMEKRANFYFQSILGIFIFHSTFLKGEKQDDSFCFQYMHRSRDLLPTPLPAESGEKCESSPVCSVVWGSHSVGSEREWTILDCGRVFPLHDEVMETSSMSGNMPYMLSISVTGYGRPRWSTKNVCQELGSLYSQCPSQAMGGHVDKGSIYAR